MSEFITFIQFSWMLVCFSQLDARPPGIAWVVGLLVPLVILEIVLWEVD